MPRRPHDITTLATLQVNPAGFAFANRPDAQPSVFIPPHRIGGALDGDEVEVQFWPSEKGFEGRVEHVVRRVRTRIAGVLTKVGGGRWRLEPEDPRILATVRVSGDPRPAWVGKVVAGRVVTYPSHSNAALSVELERVLGAPGELSTEVEKILIERGVIQDFPAEVEAEMAGLSDGVRPQDLEGRRDLRDLAFLTIDPDDARDFDDAVHVHRLGTGDGATAVMRVAVAVADVSHYVREGTAVDQHAADRAFSCYLPDRAIPMLPEVLSSDLCSLLPDQDRLAMVVSMSVDPAGVVSDVDLCAAVIHSHGRLSYGEVARELAGKSGVPPEHRGRIADLRAVADRLRAHRLRGGALELALPEMRIKLDEDDPTRIRAVERSRAQPELGRAYNLIEELMLAANGAVAQRAVERRLPLPFRVHDRPSEEKLTKLAVAALALGVEVDPEKLSQPRGVQKFLSRVKERPTALAFNMLMLRAMMQAEYRAENGGHFALASPAYVHFTSPIRRYPDLVVHRVIKAHILRSGGAGGALPPPKVPSRGQLEAHTVHCSGRERAVTQAERDAKALYAAVYMLDRVGDRLEGMVTGFSAVGMFVSLDDPFVDGMVRLSTIGSSRSDAYELEDNGVRVVARRSGDSITVGDQVVVDVENVSLPRRQVDFVLVSVRRAQ